MKISNASARIAKLTTLSGTTSSSSLWSIRIDSLQSRLDAVERDRSEPIAIVGLSCHFPGSQDPEAFWRLLSGGVDAVKEVPKDR